jgi:capsular polysaccharide biosynthesis protein
MEIVDYLRAARRHIVLIVLVPLVAAGGAAAILFLQKPIYMATATVDPPALVGGPTSQYTGAQGVVQFVAAFQATASGPVVRRAVSERTKVSTTDLADNLVVTQRGGSASVLVTYTSTNENTVAPVAEAASTETLSRMFSSQVTEAQSRLQEAQTALRTANEAVGAFTSKVRMADPQKAYEAQLTRVNALAQQQASMRASGNAVGAAAMAAPIASANAALDKFGPILSEYNSLLQVRDAAATTLAASETQLANAKSQFDAADPSKIVFVTGARLVDDTQTMMRTVVAVAAAAFFLALLIVAMLEVIARGRREGTGAGAAVPASAETAAPVVAGHGAAPERSPGLTTPTPAAGHGVPARANHHR